MSSLSCGRTCSGNGCGGIHVQMNRQLTADAHQHDEPSVEYRRVARDRTQERLTHPSRCVHVMAFKRSSQLILTLSPAGQPILLDPEERGSRCPPADRLQGHARRSTRAPDDPLRAAAPPPVLAPCSTRRPRARRRRRRSRSSPAVCEQPSTAAAGRSTRVPRYSPLAMNRSFSRWKF